MKKILSIMASVLILFSCEKEKIEPKIADNLENYYEIKNDNPDDPVQSERYKIYEEYGVPVYFNDTIAKVFVKISPTGDSVFRYERVDMNWKFTSSTSATYRYSYVGYDNDADKLKALGIIRNYLEKASKPLQPFCFLATKAATRDNVDGKAPDGSGVPYVTYEIGYRAILLQGLVQYGTPAKIDEFTTLLRKMMITARLKNFERELEEFKSVSDEKWYDKDFKTKEPEGLGVVWDSSHVMARYNNAGKFDRYEKIELSAMRITYRFYEQNYPFEPNPEETFESFRQSPRAKIGAFGFVGTNKNNSMSSYSVSAELGIFLDEILNTNREEFIRRWGTSPLVMQKYDILYKIIKEQMDVDLDAD